MDARAEAKEDKANKKEVSIAITPFEDAQPTLTHRVITELISKGIFSYVVTQNVDGLHQKSGLPREKLSILHGSLFEEKCEDCGRLHFGTVQVKTISFSKTGNLCASCGGALRDTLLDWEDALPESDLNAAERALKDSYLAITLGTSLRIQPASILHRAAKHTCIVNLQTTPEDERADFCIRARCDTVMSRISNEFL